jgi:hypothetical protein
MTYGIWPGLDAALYSAWIAENIAHAQGEANINSEQLNRAVSDLRVRFSTTFGYDRYRQAVPALFLNAWFVVENNSVTQVKVKDLGTITVRPDGSQDYRGPLDPQKKR